MFDVVTVGTATRDIYIEKLNFPIVKVKEKGFVTRRGICIPYDSKTEVPRISFGWGGSGANTAVTFRRMGFKVGLISRVGDDIYGREIQASFKKQKVKTFIQIDKQYSTPIGVILLDVSGGRTVLVYRGAEERFTPKEVPWPKIKTRWLFIGSIAGRVDLLLKLFNWAKKNKIKIAGNPGKRELQFLKKNLNLLNNYDIFVCNQNEASILTGEEFFEVRKIFKRLDKLVKGIAVMTRGKDGVMVSDGETLYKSETFKPKKIENKTGAGDAFASGFTAGYILKNNIEYAIKAGLANACSVVETIGSQAGILTKKQLDSPRWKNLSILKVRL